MGTESVALRIIAALGETGALELLDLLTRSGADRAELIGRLYQRPDGQWLAEALTGWLGLADDDPGHDPTVLADLAVANEPELLGRSKAHR